MTAPRTAKLGEVADFFAGASLPPGEPFRAQEGGYFLVKVSDMNLPGNEKYVISAKEWSKAPGPRSATCPAGSILIPKRGGAIGTNKKRIAIRPSILDPNLMAISPDPSTLDRDYLFHWLLQFDLSTIASGSSIPQLNKRDLEPLSLQVPPLASQRRIAAILNQADALRVNRQAAISRLEELTNSLFFDAFGDPLTNDRMWDSSRRLGEIADVTSGITKGRKPPGEALHSVPYLAVANVQHMRLNLSSVKMIEASETEIQRYQLKQDDLLLTEGGDPDKLGRGVLWREELPLCIHQNHIFRVRIHDPAVNPVFLSWLVSSSYGRSYFLSCAKQTTGIASINATQLRAFPLLEPPPSLQKAFADEIAQLEILKGVYKRQMLGLDALFSAIQTRAFRGEL